MHRHIVCVYMTERWPLHSAAGVTYHHFSCECIQVFFIGYILQPQKCSCNKTVCLIVCCVIIVERCYYSCFNIADDIDPCSIVSLQAHSFMCFFHFLTTSICCYAATPWSDGRMLLVIWARLIKRCFLSVGVCVCVCVCGKKNLFFTCVLLHNASRFLFLGLLKGCQKISHICISHVQYTLTPVFIFWSDKFIVSNVALIAIFSPKPWSNVFFLFFSFF